MRETINEKGILEDIKRFKQINEYSFTTGIREDDDNPAPQDNNMPPQGDGNQPPMQGMDNNAPAPDMNSNMPQPDANAPMPQDGNEPMMDAPDMGGDPNMPAPEDGGEIPDMNGAEPMQPEDEVINVDDLTNAQETSEIKIDGVDDKLTALLGIVKDFKAAIEANDAKIQDLKQEFERRNPTQVEKLNMRSLKGTPYTENPQDYFKSVEERNPNYQVEPEEKEYTITIDDINSGNSRDIMNAIDSYPSKLKDYISLS